MTDLDLAGARSIAVAAQGLHLAAGAADAPAVLGRLGCVQIDAIAVVRRSHELVHLARGVPEVEVRTLLDPVAEPRHFEHLGHAASMLPMAMWPYFALRRRHYRNGGWRGPEVTAEACRQVRRAVAAQGEVTVGDLGGTRGQGWERDSPAKWAAEWLLATGELVCTSRRSFSRVYRSAQTLPSRFAHDLPDDECLAHLVQVALDALGVATSDDVADYFRLPHARVREHLRAHADPPVRVQGWPGPAWLGSAAGGEPPLDHGRCTPLSPFDSLVWHRPRTARLFGVDYRLEAYKPAARRECGYFGMPVLVGTEIVGRVALRTARPTTRVEGRQLVAGHDVEHLDRAARTAAAWAGAVLDPDEQPPPPAVGARSC